MEKEKIICSIGVLLKRKYSAESKHRSSRHFSSREWDLLQLRSGVQCLRTVCRSHANLFGRFYAAKEKQRCNPLNVHTRIRRRNLKSITPQYHDSYHQYVKNVLESRKICIQCDEAVRATAAKNNLQVNLMDQEAHSENGKIEKSVE